MALASLQQRQLYTAHCLDNMVLTIHTLQYKMHIKVVLSRNISVLYIEKKLVYYIVGAHENSKWIT